MPTPISLGTHITLPFADLPGPLLDRLRAELTFSNPDREKAQKENLWGWWTKPEKIRCYDETDGWWRIPRGYMTRLMQAFTEHRQPFQVNSSMADVRATYPDPLMTLRPHQEVAVQELMKCAQGMYCAPPGAGKSITALELVRRAGVRAVIIVNTTNIATQWQNQITKYLGVPSGMIGDGGWDEDADIVVAMNQTLIARMDTLLRDGWFDQWGAVIHDELHHITAVTFFDVVNAFPAAMRIGVSATPDRGQGLFKLATVTFGEVVHETTRQQLEGAGFLVRPSVRRVDTGFYAPFWSTHTSMPDGDCSVPGCLATVTHNHRNNYSAILSLLAENGDRNSLIATQISANRGRTQLVLSKRLAHLRTLHEMCEERGIERLYMLTGKEKTEERVEVAQKAAEGNCVIFSTIADEALDIPRLDTLHLAWPTKSTALITQQVGRIERACEGKTDAIVYDYVDDVKAMKAQWTSRLMSVYGPQKMPVSASGQ